MRRLAIIGGGSWGTALSIVLAPRFPGVRLWVYEADLAGRMRDSRENDIYLPGFPIPTNVDVTTEMGEALDGAQVILGVMPSHRARAIYERAKPFLDPSAILVSATKGLETESLLRMSEIIYQTLGGQSRVAVMSGPTFAKEVARGVPGTEPGAPVATGLAWKAAWTTLISAALFICLIAYLRTWP